jgi:hypothetical protein
MQHAFKRAGGVKIQLGKQDQQDREREYRRQKREEEYRMKRRLSLTAGTWTP